MESAEKENNVSSKFYRRHSYGRGRKNSVRVQYRNSMVRIFDVFMGRGVIFTDAGSRNVSCP